ncbi:hypothetical protein EYF80_014794 [Liparis tanakae]|uniref:Uncharacterized protein n=1 Tax=Liparis tanakae TaxID=230148 RepID=A0A4Z2IAM7_9TELE|nr:hypothetical protein EYF80_014794 [Liparis tanakae]
MASGPESPPALPLKQHRHSSVDADRVMLGPDGARRENYEWDDVFPEAADCHAARCPVHRRYDPSQHQVRFLSDGTPPPVPKKRLSRALSLPGSNAPRHPQSFDYTLAPGPDTDIHHAEPGDRRPAGGGPDPPDEHLSRSETPFTTTCAAPSSRGGRSV